jgi:hypothetical protein
MTLSRLQSLWLCLHFVCLLPAGGLWAARHFVDVSNDPNVGLQPYAAPNGMTAGLAAADCEDDGDIDLFVPTGLGAPHQFYQNQGNGHYLERAATVGLDSPQRRKAALWFDADNDNLLDLLVAGDCWHNGSFGFVLDPNCVNTNTLSFYRQLPSGHFVDETDAAGFGPEFFTGDQWHRGGMCAGDINNDGFLDLLLTLWNIDFSGSTDQRNWLFLNNGNGTFADITAATNLDNISGGNSWQPVMHDFNQDGFIDIYAAIDFGKNDLWINQQDNSFVNVAVSAGVDNDQNDMGVAIADFDNDCDMDIYVTNVYLDENPPAPPLQINNLYRNTTAGQSLSFDAVALVAGVAYGGWGWGCTFLDMENNGWLDIAATNGFFLVESSPDPSLFYRNTGSDPNFFVDVSDEVGFNDMLWGRALLSFDSNRDGWPDLAQLTLGHTHPQDHAIRLLENRDAGPDASTNNYLVVKPRMCGLNRRAIGATVEVVAGSLTMSRLIAAGTSLQGQEPAEAHFGLGPATMADSVTIHWPSGGGSTELNNVAANQVMTITRPAPGDFDENFKVDLVDYATLCSQWLQSGPGLNADVTDDETVNLADLKRLVAFWMTDCQ